ncbi:MAG TPA: SH2 domain-containing protein [Rhabdochlamydiaceae bacterium]|nr:SH2 domain-containing protein [Rhabdochlamydiaceae bacterium]
MLKARCGTSSVVAFRFNLNDELNRHGWKGEVNVQEAEQILEGQPAFSYLIRLGEEKSKFTLSFVNQEGAIKHVHFVLVDWVNGIFQNAAPFKAPLGPFILYKMNCSADQARAM